MSLSAEVAAALIAPGPAGRPRLSLVAARARNGVIGRDGGLPWRLGSDLARFKAITLGKPILMGRKTFDSLPKRLPDRAHLVLTRDALFAAEDVERFADWPAMRTRAEALAQGGGAAEICVIGGAALYRLSLPVADRLYLTEVDAAPVGDVRFPPFEEDDFIETAREAVEPGPRDDHAFTLRVLDRRPPAKIA